MTSKTTARRVRVARRRDACWRIGSVGLTTCRECVFLLKLEVAGEPPSGAVVCVDGDGDGGPEIAW